MGENLAQKRVVWVDIVKYVCIILVMYCHSAFNTNSFEVLYKNFFLFAFFFVSGYVYKHKDGFKQFFIKKVQGLMVPWFFFSLINIFLSQVISFGEKKDLKGALIKMFLQVRGYEDRMWFLAALFMAFIPFYFIIKAYEKSAKDTKSKAILVTVSLILSFASKIYARFMNPELLPWKLIGLPWHLEYIFIMVFWMVLGYLFKNGLEEKFDDHKYVLIKALTIPAVLLLVYIPFFTGYKFGNIPGIVYTYIVELLSISALVFLCKLVKANKYVLYIGTNTLICLGVHGKISAILEKIVQKALGGAYNSIIGNDVLSVVVGLIFAVILSLVLIIPIYVIRRWFPFIMGKPYKKK